MWFSSRICSFSSGTNIPKSSSKSAFTLRRHFTSFKLSEGDGAHVGFTLHPSSSKKRCSCSPVGVSTRGMEMSTIISGMESFFELWSLLADKRSCSRFFSCSFASFSLFLAAFWDSFSASLASFSRLLASRASSFSTARRAFSSSVMRADLFVGFVGTSLSTASVLTFRRRFGVAPSVAAAVDLRFPFFSRSAFRSS